jgi:hypothetical protein
LEDPGLSRGELFLLCKREKERRKGKLVLPSSLSPHPLARGRTALKHLSIPRVGAMDVGWNSMVCFWALGSFKLRFKVALNSFISLKRRGCSFLWNGFWRVFGQEAIEKRGPFWGFSGMVSLVFFLLKSSFFPFTFP